MTQTHDKPQAEDVAEQLRIIREDVARLASMVADLAADKASTVKDTAQSVSEQARARADAYRETATQNASDAYEAGQAAVRKHPTLAVGLALGAGALLARTVLRRV